MRPYDACRAPCLRTKALKGAPAGRILRAVPLAVRGLPRGTQGCSRCSKGHLELKIHVLRTTVFGKRHKKPYSKTDIIYLSQLLFFTDSSLFGYVFAGEEHPAKAKREYMVNQLK